MAVSGQEDWFNIPDLDPVDVFGNRGAFWNFGPPGFDPTIPGTFNDPFAGITPPPDEAFAPPLPTVLPEVVITAPKLAPPPPPPPKPVSPIATVVTRVLTPIVGLLFPQPMGPRVLDEAPNPVTLPMVTVRQPRLPPTKPPKLPPISLDPIQPPNWFDLSRPGDLTRYEQPKPEVFDFNKLIDFGVNIGKVLYDATRPRADRPDTELLPLVARPSPRNPSPARITTPDRRALPDLWPEPSYRPEPFAPPEFYPSAPIPELVPTRIPRPANPRVQPRPETRPIARPSPINQPFSPLNPILSPVFDPIITPTLTPVRNPVRSPPAPALRPVPFSPLSPFVNPLQPGVDTRIRPADRVNRCSCPSTKPKDKKPKDKKKREPREICRQGTYTQRAKGIIYTPRRTIPCQ